MALLININNSTDLDHQHSCQSLSAKAI